MKSDSMLNWLHERPLRRVNADEAFEAWSFGVRFQRLNVRTLADCWHEAELEAMRERLIVDHDGEG